MDPVIQYIPIPVENPCNKGPSLADKCHVGVVVAQDPVLKLVILKLGHLLNIGRGQVLDFEKNKALNPPLLELYKGTWL